MAKGQGGSWRTTIHGYDVWEVMSALQKAIRRGEEVLAYYWVCELEASGKLAFAVTRLKIILHEDIGLGDPIAVLFSKQALDQMLEWHQDRKGETWKLALANLITAMARAKKSRLADHFRGAMEAGFERGFQPDIQDEALDRHTGRGRSLGRGFKHFVEEGTKLVNEAGIPDPYRKEAEARWLDFDKHPGKLAAAKSKTPHRQDNPAPTDDGPGLFED